MNYKLTTRFFDSSKVGVSAVTETSEPVGQTRKQGNACDEYTDICATRAEAVELRNQALNA